MGGHRAAAGGAARPSDRPSERGGAPPPPRHPAHTRPEGPRPGRPRGRSPRCNAPLLPPPGDSGTHLCGSGGQCGGVRAWSSWRRSSSSTCAERQCENRTRLPGRASRVFGACVTCESPEPAQTRVSGAAAGARGEHLLLSGSGGRLVPRHPTGGQSGDISLPLPGSRSTGRRFDGFHWTAADLSDRKDTVSLAREHRRPLCTCLNPRLLVAPTPSPGAQGHAHGTCRHRGASAHASPPPPLLESSLSPSAGTSLSWREGQNQGYGHGGHLTGLLRAQRKDGRTSPRVPPTTRGRLWRGPERQRCVRAGQGRVEAQGQNESGGDGGSSGLSLCVAKAPWDHLRAPGDGPAEYREGHWGAGGGGGVQWGSGVLNPGLGNAPTADRPAERWTPARHPALLPGASLFTGALRPGSPEATAGRSLCAARSRAPRTAAHTHSACTAAPLHRARGPAHLPSSAAASSRGLRARR